MLKGILISALICSSALITTACRTGATQGVLVGGFADEELMVATIVIPLPEKGEYRIHFALHHGDRACLLTGRVFEKTGLFFDSCDGLSGTGKISCNDGRVQNLRWSMPSCRGGSGRSIEPASPDFFFGFGLDEDSARMQLKTVQ
jgi:hypothetical protein